VALMVIDELELHCSTCGATTVTVAAATLHEDRRGGFRILVGPCPRCAELAATAAPEVVARAVRAGVLRRELLPPVEQLSAADGAELADALADEGWCRALLDPDASSGK
jgi:hypothetical protein